MGFGNFLKGVVAQVNPFDRGKTYGSYNPRKKKRDDENRANVAVVPRQNQPNLDEDFPHQISTQRPENLFAGLNKNLGLPGAPKNNFQVAPNSNLNPIPKPQPGTLIQPNAPPSNPTPGVSGVRTTRNGTQGTLATNKVTGKTNFVPDAPKPADHSFWGKVKRQAGVVKDTAVGTVANVPEVALAAGRAGTGIVQGLGHLPSVAVHGATYIPRKIAGDNSGLNRGLSSINRGVDTATHYVVDNPLDPINRGLDAAARNYANHVPMAANGAKLYRQEQVPLNILAAILTAGQSTAGQAGQAYKVNEAANAVTRFLTRSLHSNPNNIISKTGRTVSNRATPVVRAVNAPISSTKRGVTRVINSRRVPTAQQEVVGGGEVMNGVEDLTRPPTQVPVSQAVDVTAPPTEPVTIPVRNTTPQGAPIRELGGDRPGTVRIPTQGQAAEQKAADRFQNQGFPRPDDRIEGLTPRDPNAPDVVTEADIVAERKALDDALVKKEINKTQHKQANKDLDNTPTVDGEPKGAKITVKSVDSLPVQDRTVVPQGLPETPGTVRATASQAPANAKAAQVAAQAPVPIPKVGTILPDGTRVTKRMRKSAQNQAKLAKAKAKADAATAAVTDPPMLNVGLNVGDKVDALTETDIINALKSRGIDVVSGKTVGSDTERTFVPHLSRPMTTDEVHSLSDELGQEAIAHSHNGQGFLAGPKAKDWGDFNSEFFFDQNGKRLSKVAGGNKGFVKTGKYDQGRHGVIENVSKEAEAAQGAHDTANLSTSEVLSQSEKEMVDHASRTEQTVRNLKAKIEDPNIPKNTPEGKALLHEYHDSLTRHAQALAIADKVIRRAATGVQIANRFKNKLILYAKDSSKITDAHLAKIDDAENAFTEARDTANAAGERFRATGNDADFKAWQTAQQAAEKADRQARITEYTVAKDVLKGNKDEHALIAIQQAEKEAGVYSMDSVDANMLSGTGTMVRNYINTLFPRAESKLFGRISSVAVRRLAPVGGSSGRGGRLGSQIGRDTFKADVAARKEAGIGRIRRVVTAGNTLGEHNIKATAYSKGFSRYQQELKQEGYSGKELGNRAEFKTRTDPDGYVAQYERDALEANALSSLTHSKKVENVLADALQKKLANAGFGERGQQAGRFGAKAVTRVGVGFPTVIVRSLIEGLKRATLGIPEAGWSRIKYMKTGDTQQYADDLAKSIQHAGSGGSMMLLGHQLGKMGVISGAYPSDPAERKRWEAEGRQENSIKIGGQWFSIPGYLGGFALPLMLGAATGDGSVKDEFSLKSAWNTILSASPVDNIQSTLQILTGSSSDAQNKNAVSSLVRAVTPAGSFLAELARLTDSTKNDTSTKDTLHNILDSVASGIPGLNNKVNTIDKTDAYGNVLHNPNRVATVFGAQGSEQSQGKQDVQQQQTEANDTSTQLKQTGVTSNKKLMQLVDPKLAKQIADGQQLKPEDVARVQKAVTKGITATEDSNWREDGDYETDKAAMQVKLQMLEADPTAKPSDKKAFETQIKRDDVLISKKIPYDALKLYESTSLTDWRDMGDPDSDNYDADTYQQLWEIDNAMTEAGVSYKKGDLTKNKFSAKKPGKGRATGKGSRGGYSAEFGTLKAGEFAPKVQQYQTIDQQSGSIPHIAVQRPNIVHKIGSS